MEYVEQVINGMIEHYEDSKKNEGCDVLDEAILNCSIGTLMMLKSRLGLNSDV